MTENKPGLPLPPAHNIGTDDTEFEDSFDLNLSEYNEALHQMKRDIEKMRINRTKIQQSQIVGAVVADNSEIDVTFHSSNESRIRIESFIRKYSSHLQILPV